MTFVQKTSTAEIGCTTEPGAAALPPSDTPRIESHCEAPVADSSARLPDCDGIAADVELIVRCVAGEVAAWETLYAQCAESLICDIRALLPSRMRDVHRVEEIASTVWFELVKNDGQLLRKYDRNRGARLRTFLRAIARDFVARHLRSEERRRSHEMAVAGERREFDKPDTHADFQEFLGTLSEAERDILGEFLASKDRRVLGAYCGSKSRTSIWRIAREIRLKLREYFRER